MGQGTSWTVKNGGPDWCRICLALERGDVRWASGPAEWLRKNFDQTSFSPRTVNQRILDHVKAGGAIRGQRNVPEKEYDVWFNVILEMDGKDQFIKFAIDPEDDADPGVVIISAHLNNR